MQKKRKSKRGSPKSVLRLPDLDHSKASVLQSYAPHELPSCRVAPSPKADKLADHG
jgi:hypothetical protein